MQHASQLARRAHSARCVSWLRARLHRAHRRPRVTDPLAQLLLGQLLLLTHRARDLGDVPPHRPYARRSARLSGPTMLEALAGGVLTAAEAGATLARLLRELHALPARVSDDPGVRVLHLDLHPENVLLTQRGPVVIDWANAEEGHPDLDWGMSAVILAQVAVNREPHAQMAHEALAALLADCADPAARTDTNCGGLHQAVERRAANPTMSRREVELLDEAQTLIRELLTRTGR
ncbi:phosphotransferase [Streptomyces sp. PSKA28]|uniref:Phosphotransferase n=1 Tax=Streptomyces himalayensis subsp. himalayensis TaxID=2756131 RepID=A0A7W0IB44_9ACTN|nr:phosphotransferase [Streptomyces himalayensis subsp. himalayensis]